jgi:carbohydrate-binding DOMON domain-containing protein
MFKELLLTAMYDSPTEALILTRSIHKLMTVTMSLMIVSTTKETMLPRQSPTGSQTSNSSQVDHLLDNNILKQSQSNKVPSRDL